jgi:hypothetical protein
VTRFGCYKKPRISGHLPAPTRARPERAARPLRAALSSRSPLEVQAARGRAPDVVRPPSLDVRPSAGVGAAEPAKQPGAYRPHGLQLLFAWSPSKATRRPLTIDLEHLVMKRSHSSPSALSTSRALPSCSRSSRWRQGAPTKNGGHGEKRCVGQKLHSHGAVSVGPKRVPCYKRALNSRICASCGQS